MQHMDEGLLQAWLDGPRAGLTAEERVAVEAHLAECPVCTERVESLRATNDRVRELMAAVEEVDEEIPPFAGVLRRAGELDGESRPPASPPVRPWWGRRTAWAASILVALGAGWLANEWNSTTPDIRLDPLQVREAPGSFEAAEEEGAAAGDAAELRSDELDRLEVPPVESPAAGAEAPAPTVEVPATAGDAARSLATASPTRPAQESRLAPLPAEPDPVARLSVARTARVPSVPKGLEDDRWGPVSMEEAWDHLGRVVETVRGSPVTGVHIGTFDEVPVVRVEQELDDGSPLILIQSRTPVRVTSDDAGSVDTVVTAEELFVAGWADLPVDSLRRMLRGIALN